jgi:hypothetical protein
MLAIAFALIFVLYKMMAAFSLAYKSVKAPTSLVSQSAFLDNPRLVTGH